MAATPRFLTLADVAEVLNTSSAQVYALVRRGDLVAIKIGGRGQWRVEADRLEDYISAMYVQAEEFVAQHPFAEPADEADELVEDDELTSDDAGAGPTGPDDVRR